MKKEISRREREREQRIAQLALMIEYDSRYRDVRAVSDFIDGIAGESVSQ